MTTPDKQNLHVSKVSFVTKALLLRLDWIIIGGLFFGAVVSFIALTVILWHYTVDDAFITFRYAENIVKGWGPTFNQASPRAEGYTSILWTLLMALPHLAGINVVLFSKVVGVCLTAGTICVLAYGMLGMPEERIKKNRWFSTAFASVFFLTWPFGPVHAVSGMETALAAFLYTLITVLFLKAQEGGAPTALLPLSCLFLGLTRPEANLFSVVLLALLLLCLPTPNRKGFAVRCFTFYILPGILYFTWRYCYYGLLFPLPFYIKSTGADLSGMGPVLSFAKDLGIGVAFPISIFLFFTKASFRRLLIVIPIIFMFSYFMTIQHIMGYGHRYCYPLVPVLSLLFGLGLAELQDLSHVRTRLSLLLCIAFTCAFGVISTIRARGEYLSYANGLEKAHILLGRTLAAVAWTSNPVIAIGDAGALPYYSRLDIIDTFGLNTAIIAMRFRGNPSTDRSDCVLLQSPTVVVLISNKEDAFDSPLLYENALYRSCLEKGFSRHVTFVFRKDYYLWVMWHPDLQDAHNLEEVLRRASLQNHEIRK